MTMSKQYDERDVMALDRAGNYYIKHVGAMTAEKLHDKSDIAAELAYRDWLIDDLSRQLKAYQVNFDDQEELLEQLYWEFDSERKANPENERILFKGKMRFFTGQVTQYLNTLVDALKNKETKHVYDDLPDHLKIVWLHKYKQWELGLKDEHWEIRLLSYRVTGFTEEAFDDPEPMIRLQAYHTLGFTEKALTDTADFIREEAKESFDAWDLL